MPEIQNMQVKPGEIKKGDLLDDVAVGLVVSGKTRVEHGHMVESIKRGPENMILETTGGRIIIKHTTNFDGVSIRRSVKTDAEQLDDDCEAVTGMVDQFVHTMRQTATTSPLEWLTDKLRVYEDNVASGLTWYAEEAMLKSHERKLAQSFIAALEHNAAQELHGEGISRLDLIVEFHRDLERQLLNLARNTSRSTSPVSNVSDDNERKAVAELLSSGYPGLSWIKARIEQLYADQAKVLEADLIDGHVQ